MTDSDDFMSVGHSNNMPVRPLLWNCVYCDENFESKTLLKIHFSKHRLLDKVNATNATGKCCPCRKQFSEFHYFENHLLQTGHMNNSYSKVTPSIFLTTRKLCQNQIKCHSPSHLSSAGFSSYDSLESNYEHLTTDCEESSLFSTGPSFFSNPACIYIYSAAREFITGMHGLIFLNVNCSAHMFLIL